MPQRVSLKLTLLLAAVGCVVAVVLWQIVSVAEPAGSGVGALTGQLIAEPRPPGSQEVEGAGSFMGAPVTGARVIAGDPAASGRRVQVEVVDGSGRPIVGASVSIHPISDALTGLFGSRVDDDWLLVHERRRDRLRSEAILVETGSLGRAVAEVGIGGSEGSVLIWASHQEYLAGFVGPLEVSELGGEVEIELREAGPVLVQVIGLDGRGVAGASVTHQLVRLESSRTASELEPDSICRALWRSYETDLDGIARVHPFVGASRLQAQHMGLRSQPRAVGEESEIMLHLLSSATLGGRVSLDEGFSLGPWAMVAVSAIRTDLQGYDFSGRVSAVAVEDGRYGPVLLPLDPLTTSYRVELLHGGNEAIQHVVPPPLAGEYVDVNFHAGPGVELWVQVNSEVDDRALEGATVAGEWTTSGGAVRRHQAMTNQSGWCRLYGLPADLPVSFHVQAPAHEAAIFQPALLKPEYQKDGLGLWLEPVGALEVRLGSESQPALAFDAILTSHFGSSSGFYRVPGVPSVAEPGVVKALFDEVQHGIYALDVVTEGGQFLREASVEIVPGKKTTVELLGLEGRPVFGRVIGDVGPIEGAEVSIRWIHPFDARSVGQEVLAETDAAGEFYIESVSGAPESLMVSAEGYLAEAMLFPADGLQGLDFGTVRLRRQEIVVFRLEPAPPVPSRYSLRSRLDPGPSTFFDADGRAEYQLLEEVSSLLWTRPDGGYSTIELPSASREEPVVLPVSGEGEVYLHMGPEVAELAARSQLVLQRNLDGYARMVTKYPVPSQLPVFALSDQALGPVKIELLSSTSESLYFAEHSLSADEPLHIYLDGQRDRLELDVRDPGGAPVSHALCTIWSGSAFARDYQEATIIGDENGGVSMPWPSMERFTVVVEAPGSKASSAIASTDLERGGAPFPVTLGGDFGVSVLVESSSRPMEGASVRLYDASGMAFLDHAQSGSDGMVRFAGLPEGRFRVWVDSPNTWSAVFDKDASTSDQPHRIALIGYGTLELKLLDRQGAPVSGFAPVIRHVGLDETVDDWDSTGQLYGGVQASDESGKLSYSALPAGTLQFEDPAGVLWEIELPEDYAYFEVVVNR